MRRFLVGLLVTVTLAIVGVCPPAVQAADDTSTQVEAQADDGMGLMEERAATAADDGSDETGPLAARYLVTFIKSRTADPFRAATVVSVTNQAERVCQVSVEWVRGFEPPSACTTTLRLEAGITADLCSRAIPNPLTTCNATCEPELTFHEGRAVVSSSSDEGCERIGVSARVYYTTGDDDDDLVAISDSKIVLFGKGNRGD